MRWPERFDPGVVSENVNLCDLFTTLCELTGTPFPENHTLDSRSLVPLLEDRRNDWLDAHDDETVSAYGEDLMIIHGDLKYIYAENYQDALFDLDADPGETENRIDNPEYTDAVCRFRERRDGLGYGPNANPDYDDAGYVPGVGQ